MHRKIDRFDSSSNQPQSFGDFDHGPETSHGRTPKLTCPSPTTTTGARGLPRFHGVGDEEPPYDMRETLRSLANWKKHKLCLLSILLQLHPTSQPKGPTSLQSILIDDNGTPATWTLVLSSSKPLTGRTGHYRLRDASVYWNYWRYSLTKGILPLPDKDSSHDDMPCRTPLH